MNSCCILIMWSSSQDALLSSRSASAFILFSSNAKNLLSDSFVCLSSCSNTSAILLSASVLFLRVPEVEGVLFTAVVVAVVLADVLVTVGPLSSSSVVSPSLSSPSLLSASSFCWWSLGPLPLLLQQSGASHLPHVQTVSLVLVGGYPCRASHRSHKKLPHSRRSLSNFTYSHCKGIFTTCALLTNFLHPVCAPNTQAWHQSYTF